VPEPSPVYNSAPIGLQARESTHTSRIAEAVRAGLTATPKSLPPVLFYDSVGSQLFEQICRCPEYYLTRTEKRILSEHAGAIAAAFPQRVTLVELGCGSAEKTEVLLRAMQRRGQTVRFLACDVSEPALTRTVARLRANHPTLDVTGVLGDFDYAIEQAPRLQDGACVWAFLGSSIGNFDPAAANAFLQRVRRAANGHLLLGADMVKDEQVLHAAYDDAAGVTAAFNRNVLHRINRELDADFAPQTFAHRARYCTREQRIEMHLVSSAEQTVHVERLGLVLTFARGESIHTENSYKYTPADLRQMATASGFASQQNFTDRAGWFTVALWAPA
jgi:dimethylhistidine N-methyltransferase